jgi:transcriptional regulator with XRE-family HTH domain
MQLSVGEKIMIFRHRKGLKIGELGDIVFGDQVAPHHPIKRIESGVRTPTVENLNDIANALDIDVNILLTDSDVNGIQFQDNMSLNSKFEELFPKLPKYIALLNSSIMIDENLVVNIFQEMAKYITERKKDQSNNETN